MLQLSFIDTEGAWCPDLHKAYTMIDPKAGFVGQEGRQEAKGARYEPRHREACKRIFAAAALDITIDDEGAVSIDGLHSWTEHDHGDECAVVTGLFDHLRFRPDNKAVSYSGLASDLPRLTLASMEYGLSLPSQLQSGHRVRPGQIRPHCDLALELKGNGRDWAHLSEIGLRMGLPWQLFANKIEVNRPHTAEQWLDVRQHVSFDTVLTAMIMMGWLKAQERAPIDVPATIYHLAEWYCRNGRPSEKLRKDLASLCRQMMDRIAIRLDKAA